MLASGIHLRDSERRFLVVDLGGGSFDVPVLDPILRAKPLPPALRHNLRMEFQYAPGKRQAGARGGH